MITMTSVRLGLSIHDKRIIYHHSSLDGRRDCSSVEVLASGSAICKNQKSNVVHGPRDESQMWRDRIVRVPSECRLKSSRCTVHEKDNVYGHVCPMAVNTAGTCTADGRDGNHSHPLDIAQNPFTRTTLFYLLLRTTFARVSFRTDRPRAGRRNARRRVRRFILDCGGRANRCRVVCAVARITSRERRRCTLRRTSVFRYRSSRIWNKSFLSRPRRVCGGGGAAK